MIKGGLNSLAVLSCVLWVSGTCIPLSYQFSECDLNTSGVSFADWYGTPLQYSCLENPRDGGAWWATSPRGGKESDTTERLHFPFSLSCTGEGNGNPFQCYCLENPRDGGAWWADVYGVAESDTTEVT